MGLIQEKDEPIIIDLFKNGNSYRKIADQFNCGTNTIYEVLKKNNIRKNRAEVTIEVTARVIEDYKMGMGIRDLATRYDYHSSTIANALRQNGIEIRNSGYASICKTYTDLTDIQIEIINGLLLSDGCCRGTHIRRSGTKTPYFTVTTIHKEFDDHIRGLLPFHWNTSIQAACKKTICSEKLCNTKENRQVFTRVDLCFHQFRSDWYPQGIKIIPRNLILTPTVVKYWFYGDGYSTYEHRLKNNRKGVRIGLCTNCFTVDDCEFLVDRFKIDVGISFNIHMSRGQPRLVSCKYDTVSKFFDYIGTCDLECFAYKWKRPSEPLNHTK